MHFRDPCSLVLLLSIATGAEGSMVRGSARAFDHNQLIHEIWSLALKSAISIWIERVPSKYNVADSPSRHEWEILDDLGLFFVMIVTMFTYK